MIYSIINLVGQTIDYVCPDQATIDEGQAQGILGTFSIGTETDANNILATNQNAWLNQNASLFHVNKQINLSDGYYQWIVVDLNTEPANVDVIYQIFDVVNGNYNQAIGLTSAQSLFIQTQQNYLTFSDLASFSSLDSWPAKPKPKTTGTQTL